MGFIDSYKRVEKICGELMRDERRLTAYIDQMMNTRDGEFYVRGWKDDLKQLKHYRWIRNQIVHEPGCTEQSMCKAGDAEWLDQFYSRLMDQTDPLALYEKNARWRKAPKPVFVQNKPEPPVSRQNAGGRKILSGWILGISILYAVFLIVLILIIFLPQMV